MAEPLRPQNEWQVNSTTDEAISDVFSRIGFVCLSQVLDTEILEEWREFCAIYFEECFQTLYEQGHTTFLEHCRQKPNGKVVEYALECGAKNGFREIVMRSPGRYEMSLLECEDRRPTLDPILEVLAPVIPPLLQETSLEDLQLCHVSLLMATPAATDQILARRWRSRVSLRTFTLSRIECVCTACRRSP